MKFIAYQPKDFEWTRWQPEQITAAASAAVAARHAANDSIAGLTAGQRTFKNTVFALDQASAEFFDVFNRVELLMNVSPDEAVRNAAHEASQTMLKELIDIVAHEGVYSALKEYAAQKEPLRPAEQKLLSDMLRDYRRLGLDLGPTARQEFIAKRKRLTELGSKFRKNINDSHDRITVAPNRISGLPNSFLNQLDKDAGGNYIVSTDYSEYYPFVTYADDHQLRKQLMDLFYQKGGRENLTLLAEMVALRHECAKLLGYAHHGDYGTEDRMAKSAKVVFDFLNDLVTQLAPGVDTEHAALETVKKQKQPETDGKILYYDILYYLNLLRRQKYEINEHLLREYFPFDVVKRGVFDIYEQLLGVRFVKTDQFPVWHEQVEVYEVQELNGGVIGYFMMDMFPRPGKYGHAAEFPLFDGRVLEYPDGETYRTSLCCLVMNVAKPTPGQPSLLSQREVETFFHEFGHVMHQVLTRAEFTFQAGTSVARDFVEAPSQMLENWVWDKEVLQKISGHYKDPNKKLPNDLADKLVASRLHGVYYTNMRQLVMGLFDMRLHTEPEQASRAAALYRELNARYTKIELAEDNIFPAGFGHLEGYDAGYYGYMWSNVYAADMFTRFIDAGLFSAEVGREYRTWILEKGSSIDELDLIRKFLGREPNNEAFLKLIGL